MIRDGTLRDWPEVDRMARAFRDSAMTWAAYDPKVFRRVYQGLSQDRNGLALVLDLDGAKGVLLAAALPSPFSGELAAQEIMWWIDPSARGGSDGARMLDAYELWTRDVGAAHAGVTCLDERVARLFDRRGYQRAEILYRVH